MSATLRTVRNASHAVAERVRRHGDRKRRARPRQVVVADPAGELDDIRREKRLDVENALNVPQLEVVRAAVSLVPMTTPVSRARPKRHDHARAGGRHGVSVGNSVSEQVERWNGNRDLDETLAAFGRVLARVNCHLVICQFHLPLTICHFPFSFNHFPFFIFR